MVCKRHLTGVLNDDQAYLYTFRFLLERLSWFARDSGRELHYTLAHIVRFKIEKLREYESRLRAAFDCQVAWPSVDPRGGRLEQPSRVEMLQLADLAASATFQAFEPDRHVKDPSDAPLPNPWELAQVPAMILGGELLGLLAARLLPAWLAAPAAAMIAVMWIGTLSSSPSLGLQMLAVLPEWVQYREDDDLILFEPGSFGWHNAFLFGLCGLGLVAALLREPDRRGALLAADGAVVRPRLAGAAGPWCSSWCWPLGSSAPGRPTETWPAGRSRGRAGRSRSSRCRRRRGGRW